MSAIIQAVREQVDKSPISLTQFMVFTIAFMLNVVDGFDVVAMSVAMPSLTDAWHLSPTDKGYILSSALIGMTLGAIFLAPLADVYGRKRVVVTATLGISLTMIITGLLPESVPLMMAIRCLSGLGIGVIFANSATIGTEFAPEKYRNMVVTIVVMGYASGATLVGPIANWIIPLQGWHMLFIYGGIFTFLMSVFMYLYMPESVEFIANSNDTAANRLSAINKILINMRCAPLANFPESDAPQRKTSISVKNLFRENLGLSTLGIWTIYFMGFLSMYFLMAWIPTLFVNSGYERADGVAALTMFNLGAVVGIVLIAIIGTSIKLAKPISIYFIGSALFLFGVYYQQPDTLFWLNLLIFVIGFLLQGGFTAMYALAARVYPAHVRATGMGWAAGLGRTGAIISPIFAGYLVSANWSMYQLFLIFALPLLIAGLCVWFYRD